MRLGSTATEGTPGAGVGPRFAGDQPPALRLCSHKPRTFSITGDSIDHLNVGVLPGQVHFVGSKGWQLGCVSCGMQRDFRVGLKSGQTLKGYECLRWCN